MAEHDLLRSSGAFHAPAAQRSRTLRLPVALAAVLAFAAFALAPQTGHATVSSSVVSGALTITADAADNITLTVVGGNVKINGSDPGTGVATAASITSIAITCTGNFANTINLAAVLNPPFTSSPKCTVNCGAGNDNISAGGGFVDTMYGEDGDDTIYGGAGNDNLYGGPGADTVYGEAGTDKFYCDAGGDTLIGGLGNDTFNIAAPANGVTVTVTEAAAGGTDVILYDAYPLFKSEITDTPAAGTITGTGIGTVNYTIGQVETRTIKPTVSGLGGALAIDMWTGDFAVTDVGGNVKVNGKNPDNGATLTNTILVIGVTSGDHISSSIPNTIDLSAVTAANGWNLTSVPATSVSTTAGADIVYGSEFKDLIAGGDDIDTISGNAGNDTIDGGKAVDTINGGDGDDSILGGVGADVIDGGGGNDTIDGSDGNDTITGGAGNDTVYGSSAADTINMSAGTDTLYGDGGVGTGAVGNDVFNMSPPVSGDTVTIDGQGGAGDNLVYDLQGHTYSDSGSAVTITDGVYGTVNYSNIETKTWLNPPIPQMIKTPYVSDGGTPAGALFSVADLVAGNPGTGKVTISNTGTVDLTVSALQIIGDPPATPPNATTGYFKFEGGSPPSLPATVKPQSEDPTSVLVVPMLFDPGLAVSETKEHLMITSNDQGNPGTTTTVPLRGCSLMVDEIWDAGTDNAYATAANWNPNAAPTQPFMHLKIDDTTSTPAVRTSNLALGLNNPYMMTISGNKLSLTNTSNLQFQNRGELKQSGGELAVSAYVTMGNNADSLCTYTLTGGTVNITGTGELRPGGGGAGALVMSNGTVNAKGLVIGNNAGALGLARISGGTMNLSDRIAVGRASTGTLELSGTANVTALGNMIFGQSIGGSGSFKMTGGHLKAATITTGTLGNGISSWSWTGGTITAGTFALPITIENHGATLAPGGSSGVGTTSFVKTNYTQASALEINVDETGAADQLVIDGGAAVIGGEINIVVLNGGPTSDGQWDVIIATNGGSIDTSGATINLPTTPRAECWSIVTQDSTKLKIGFDANARVEDWLAAKP